MERREVKKNSENDDSDVISGRLSDETIKYFQRVDQILDENVFEDEEHKETFIRNVFVQIEADGTHLARHSNKTSRIIEKLIPYLTGELYEKFIHIIETELEMLVCDRFASHVIETLCKSSLLHCENSSVVETFVYFCKLIRKNCSVFIRNTYGSHVISVVLQVLSGVKVPETVTKSYASRNSNKKTKKSPDNITEPCVTEVPRLFKKCFKKYVSVIQNDMNFGELICHRTGSPVLHVLLVATSKISQKNYQLLYSTIVARGRIFELGDNNGGVIEEDISLRLPIVFVDDVGSHLFEAIIKTADKSNLEELTEKCFKNCIVALCIHPVANYLAQTLLRSLKTLEHVQVLVSKLLEYTEDILAAGNMGCIVRVAEVINRFEMVEYQKRFITTLSNALHIPEDTKGKPLVKLLLCMMTYDLFYNVKDDKSDDLKESNDEKSLTAEEPKGEVGEIKIKKDCINYHGACLLKNSFLFKKCRNLVESFVELTVEELIDIACHPHGCFVFESYFQSQWIPLKSKSTTAETLLLSIERIARDKFGSRVVDCIWKGVDDAMQERIRSILRDHKSKLESDLYGRIILYNCGVKQHVLKMRDIEKKQEMKRKMFEDIIEKSVDDVVVPATKQKKKNDDRAAKYREQLKSLGIAIVSDEEKLKTANEEEVDENKDDAQDDLADVLNAIEATVKTKAKKNK